MRFVSTTRSIRLLANAAIVALMIAWGGGMSATHAQDEFPGLNPGDEAPAFTLKNQDGEDVSLASLISEKPVAVLFFRSAGW